MCYIACMSICGGWRQDRPEPYQLVMLRELVNGNPGRAGIDLKHVGYWNGMFYCALSKEKSNGDKMPKGQWVGVEIVNIYGWQNLNEMEPNV